MAGAGGFPSLVSVLRHEFASFPECDLFFSPLVEFLFLRSAVFIFHIMLIQKDTRGTLKVLLAAAKPLSSVLRQMPHKILYILKGVDFRVGRTCVGSVA